MILVKTYKVFLSFYLTSEGISANAIRLDVFGSLLHILPRDDKDFHLHAHMSDSSYLIFHLKRDLLDPTFDYQLLTLHSMVLSFEPVVSRRLDDCPRRPNPCPSALGLILQSRRSTSRMEARMPKNSREAELAYEKAVEGSNHAILDGLSRSALITRRQTL